MCLIQDDLVYNKYIKVNNVSVAFTVCDLWTYIWGYIFQYTLDIGLTINFMEI